ncbi:MAG TPA: hypothetical protein VIG33_16260 [Pseudobdellovibrionaceae bacterium]|jgi:hypothetical protein
MTLLKKAAQYFSALCLLASFNARAADAICDSTNFETQKLTNKDRSHQTMMGVRPTYSAKLGEGFSHSDKSGLLLKENKIVPWGAGDILSVRPQNSDEQTKKGIVKPVKFFVQYDRPPYNNVNDKRTKGGIYKVDSKVQNTDGTGVSCSTEPNDYAYHYFPDADEKSLVVGSVYCVRTRSGNEYTLIRVTHICDNGVVFDYKYNGDSNVFEGVKKVPRAAPHESKPTAPGSHPGKS